MALLFLNTVKYWSKTIGITVGMSLLRTYSNTYIFIRKQCSNVYESNKTIQQICNTVFTWTHPIIEWVYFKKLEPFYDPWCTILYHSNGKLQSQPNSTRGETIRALKVLKVEVLRTSDPRGSGGVCEHYINLNKTIHNIYFSDKHILFCLNPSELNDDENKCDLIQTMMDNIRTMWSSSEPLLMIVKMKHQYISRVNIDKNTKISLEKTRKHLLCVEYIHPKMSQSIYLDIHPGYYVEGNEIFSELFVKRCLLYQKSAYVFDSDYTLKIMDSMMRTVEMHCNEYMIVDKNNYKIMSLEGQK